MSALLGLDEVRAAAEVLEGVAVPTPLLDAPELSDEVGCEVRLKCENLQRTGSFKIRGAYNFVFRLPGEAAERGVITYSSGNHGQAVALAARLRGTRAAVVMPTTAPGIKRRGVERLGGEVIFEGTTSEERRSRAESVARERGWTLVPPFHHPFILAGQGTVGLEIHGAVPDVDVVLVPVGGGGLLSGCAAALRVLRPKVRIVGVEPRTARSMARALEEGGPVTVDGASTVADGLAPVRVSRLTWFHARELVDEMVAVDDAAIEEAVAWLFRRGRLVVEPSGAATVAALRSEAVGAAGERVVAVLSGGNLDERVLRAILDTQRGEEGR